MKHVIFSLVAMLVAISASAAVTSFEVDIFEYSVVKAATSSTQGEVAIAGLSALGYGEVNVAVNPSSTVSYRGLTYKITSIAANAFKESTRIKSVNTSSDPNMRSIGMMAFYGCTNLTSVTTQASIDGYAFAGCTALASVKLNDGVTSIGGLAFKGCVKLTEITIPYSTSSIGANFVDDCTAMTKIDVALSNNYYHSYDGILYNNQNTILYRCPEGKQYTGSTNYYSYDIYKFPPSLKTVNDNAFKNTKAKIIQLPVGTETIGSHAFEGSQTLAEVIIPNTVRTIGNMAFMGCKYISKVICNIENVAGINMGSDVFYNTELRLLKVPYGKGDDYKAAAQWKNFPIIRTGSYDCQYGSVRPINKYDTYMTSFPCYYTIFDRTEFVKDGVKYYGKARLESVRRYYASAFAVIMGGEIEHNTRKYLVTSVGNEVLFTDNDAGYSTQRCCAFYVGENVDTIMDKAFYAASVDSVHMGPNVKFIGSNAFAGNPLKGDLILPYGLNQINANAFADNNFNRILIPSSVNSMSATAFKNSSKLKELHINAGWIANYSNWDLSGAPSTLSIYVPIEKFSAFKTNSLFGSCKVYAGASDFTREGVWPSEAKYLITVTSNSPVTVGGVTYDGKAQYVFNPFLSASETTYRTLNEETNLFHNSGKKYLMTAFGNSALSMTNIAVVDIEQMKNLATIGNYAFAASQITSFTVPSSVSSLGEYAFASCTKLKELTLMPPSGSFTYGTAFYGGNASDFTCYVKWTSLYSYRNNVKNWPKLNGSTKEPIDQLNGYIMGGTENMVASVLHPVDWNASGMSARYVTSYGEQKVYTKPISATAMGEGVLLTGVDSNTMYKLQRPAGNPAAMGSSNLLKGITDVNANVYTANVGYYFNATKKKFVRPTATCIMGCGNGYLEVPYNFVGTSTQDVDVDIFFNGIKGDVDGNGEVDITDANILINIMLGKDSASKYGGRADVTGDGVVDVSDVNAIINIILNN